MHFSDETNTDIFICLSGKTICCLHITHIRRVALMDFESESEWFRVIYLFLNKKAAELMTEKKSYAEGRSKHVP